MKRQVLPGQQQIQIQQQMSQSGQQQPLPQISQLTGQRIQFPGTISPQINVQQVTGGTLSSSGVLTPSSSSIVSASAAASSPVLTQTLVSGAAAVAAAQQHALQQQQISKSMTVTGSIPTSASGTVASLQVTPSGPRIFTTSTRAGQQQVVARQATEAELQAFLRQQRFQQQTQPQQQQQMLQQQVQPQQLPQSQSKTQILQIQSIQQPQQQIGIQQQQQTTAQLQHQGTSIQLQTTQIPASIAATLVKVSTASSSAPSSSASIPHTVTIPVSSLSVAGMNIISSQQIVATSPSKMIGTGVQAVTTGQQQQLLQRQIQVSSAARKLVQQGSTLTLQPTTTIQSQHMQQQGITTVTQPQGTQIQVQQQQPTQIITPGTGQLVQKFTTTPGQTVNVSPGGATPGKQQMQTFQISAPGQKIQFKSLPPNIQTMIQQNVLQPTIVSFLMV